MGPVRRQHGEHLLVIECMPDQGPADECGQVVIADRDRVAVTEGPLRHLGGRPRPHPRNHLKPGQGSLPRHPCRLLHPVGDGSRRPQRMAPGAVHPAPVPRPVRDFQHCRRGGHDTHTGWRRSRCRRAGHNGEFTPGPVCLGAGHLLLEDGRDQDVPHPPGPGDAQTRVTSPGVGEQARWRLQPGPVVPGPE